jgi:hypothetical protein
MLLQIFPFAVFHHGQNHSRFHRRRRSVPRNSTPAVMPSFFSPNIDNKGRLARAIFALGLFVGAAFAFIASNIWLGAILAACGAVSTFQAIRGWCIMRACGFKTKY